MKKLLFAALLAAVCCWPLEEVKATIANAYHRAVEVNISGWVLYATSDTEDGTITKIEVLNHRGQVVLTENGCSGYSCSTSISGLPSGVYTAKVVCAYTTYTEVFIVGS